MTVPWVENSVNAVQRELIITSSTRRRRREFSQPVKNQLLGPRGTARTGECLAHTEENEMRGVSAGRFMDRETWEGQR